MEKLNFIPLSQPKLNFILLSEKRAVNQGYLLVEIMNSDVTATFYVKLNRLAVSWLTGPSSHKKLNFALTVAMHCGYAALLHKINSILYDILWQCNMLDKRTWGHEEYGQTLSKSYVWPVPLPDNDWAAITSTSKFLVLKPLFMMSDEQSSRLNNDATYHAYKK